MSIERAKAGTASEAEELGADERESGVQRVAQAWTGTEPTTAGTQRSRAGWTVLEEYERDGFYYQVLRRPVDCALPRLTPREEEVLQHAGGGYSNKSIAYALGLSPSTVGVLLFRAAGKLGAGSRRELLAAYAEWKRRSP
jgi:DNA-binding CsgD family transcriptional regulator